MAALQERDEKSSSHAICTDAHRACRSAMTSAGAANHPNGFASVSPAVAAILASADVWDMTRPWMPVFWGMDNLARFKRAGFTFVAPTLRGWPPSVDDTRPCVERVKEIAT